MLGSPIIREVDSHPGGGVKTVVRGAQEVTLPPFVSTSTDIVGKFYAKRCGDNAM